MEMTGNKRSSSVVKAGNAQPKKNLWKPEEDLILRQYVETHGEGNWANVSERSGLKRGGKSCRLRWKNYLRPNIKRGDMSQEEQDLIIRMHKLLGNRWSLIAGRLPGRTDNEVKNYWNTHLNKNISCCPAAGSKRKSTTITDYSNDGINITKKKNKIGTGKTTSTATTTTDDPMITSSTDRIPKDTSCDHQHQHHKEPNIESMFTSTSTEESWFYDDMDLESPRELQYYQYYLPSFSSNFNAAFAFDDEPFIGYMDSFLLFD